MSPAELAFLLRTSPFFQLAHGAQSERELADMQANELADIQARLRKLELADMQARLRKLKSVGGGRCGRADRQEPTAPTGKCFTCGQVGCKASTCPNGNQDAQQRKLESVGGGRCGRADSQEPTAPTGKCFTCGQVGCKSSTCPNGNQDAQQKYAAKKAERERANPQRQCLLPPELFRKFLGTVHYDLSYELEAQALIQPEPMEKRGDGSSRPKSARPGSARPGGRPQAAMPQTAATAAGAETGPRVEFAGDNAAPKAAEVVEAKFYGDGTWNKAILGAQLGPDHQQVMFVGYEADDWQDTAAKDIRYPVKIGGSHSGGSAGDTSTERACITVAPVLPPYLRTGLAKHGDSMVHIYNTQFRIMPDRTSKKRLAQLVGRMARW
jgi:hypothetical protein